MMRRMRAFAKKNTLEMLRDPVIYFFCLGFPVVMIILFQVINRFTGGQTPMFEAPALIPGIMMFSFTFVMLSVSLSVSRDRTSAFLVRLYSSPMKTSDYVLGYMLPSFVVGIGQEIVCLLTGYIASLIVGGAYFSFAAALLLMVEMLPMLGICIFFGVFFGSVLGEKSAPGITSVLIAAAGMLGGAWMPLETMGGFATFCRFLPFYPAVYIGRVVTGAQYVGPSGALLPYTFDSVAALGLIPIAVFFAAGLILALVGFKSKMTGDGR